MLEIFFQKQHCFRALHLDLQLQYRFSVIAIHQGIQTLFISFQYPPKLFVQLKKFRRALLLNYKKLQANAVLAQPSLFSTDTINYTN